MPTNDLISSQMSNDQYQNCVAAMRSIINELSSISTNLTPEERQTYGSIHERNKLLVSKVRDYRMQQESLSSPDVDWATFEESWTSRNHFAELEMLCNTIMEMCSDPRILHDYRLYHYALVDYDYSKYKASSTSNGAGYTTKVEEIKQFFPNAKGHQAAPKTEATE
ncbi:MAG: hypothetical protein V4561_05315 [Bacteroidota bacterium]